MTFCLMQERTIIGKPWWWLAAIVATYLVLAVGADLTYMPWCDEAWFATPGFNLAADGSFGTPVLDETATWNARNLRGINKITYWFMPLHPVIVAGWSMVAGTSLYAVRFLSTLWGLIALGAWFLIVRKLAEPDSIRPALFMAGLLAIDFQFVWYAGEGRMDMMTEALLSSAFASYLWLREKDFTRAVLVSQTFMMLAGMTHPISLGGFVGLFFLTLYFDRRKIRLKHAALAALPYVIAGAGWGLFISKDPGMFWDQFYGNITGRLAREGGWLESIWAQYKERFLWMYGLHPDTHGASHLKIIVFITYMAGLAMGWSMRDFRNRPTYRGWLILCAVLFLCYSNLDKDVHEFYLIHIMAPAIATLALVLDWVLKTGRAPAWAVAGVLLVVGSIQLMTTVSRIRQDAYHTRFMDATAYLKQNTRPGELIMGSSELGFELGWKSNLVDDYRLGYRTGKRPDVVVLDKNRYQEFIPNLKVFDPKAYAFTTGLLAREFHEVHRNDGYIIYFRTDRANP
jgi:hypothetical protein